MIKRLLVLLTVLGVIAPVQAGVARADVKHAPRATVYEAVLRQLLKDQVEGQTIDVLYVIDGAVEGADDPGSWNVAPNQPFDRSLKRMLRQEFPRSTRVRFIDDRSSVIAGRPPGAVVNGGALVTLGPIRADGTEIEVPNSIWFNGLNGRWMTYVVGRVGQVWKVVGTTGPVAVS